MNTTLRTAILALTCAIGLPVLHAEQVPKGEPTNAKEAAERKAAIDKATDEKYQTWRAGRPEAEQAWLSVLEENLGTFYLPLFKADKVNGRVTAWDYVTDDPKLPRVLLIGDSISRGYTLDVRNALSGKVNVHRAPANCGSTVAALAKLDIWLGDGRWDLIHFNFGIHDRATKDETYTANLQTIIDRLRKTGATLVWGRTTPSIDGQNNEKYTPERCQELNQLADAVMQRNNIAIDDLYSAVQPRLSELQLPKNVHFIAAGYGVLGKQAAAAITAALPPAKP